MKTSDTGIHVIKYFEGVRFRPYMCSGNVWTVGAGHALYPRQLVMNLADRKEFKLKYILSIRTRFSEAFLNIKSYNSDNSSGVY